MSGTIWGMVERLLNRRVYRWIRDGERGRKGAGKMNQRNSKAGVQPRSSTCLSSSCWYLQER